MVAATYPHTDCFNPRVKITNSSCPHVPQCRGLSQCRSYGFPHALTPGTQSTSSQLCRHGSYVVPSADVSRGVEVTRIRDCILRILHLVCNAHSGGVPLSRNISEAPLHVASTSTRVHRSEASRVSPGKTLAGTSRETTGEKTVFGPQN